MSSDIGIREDAAAAGTTRVTPATAVQLEEHCTHGKVLWRIDGQLWHVRSITREQPFLVPCDQQLPLLEAGLRRRTGSEASRGPSDVAPRWIRHVSWWRSGNRALPNAGVCHG